MSIILMDFESSNLRSASYDDTDHRLYVTFKNGQTYEYAHVPIMIAEGLRNAISAGSYFAAHIRDKYQYKKAEAYDPDRASH